MFIYLKYIFKNYIMVDEVQMEVQKKNGLVTCRIDRIISF